MAEKGGTEKKNTIYLNNLDGYEFEKICEEIFSKKYSGKIERTSYAGDKGRDLIIYSPEGKIFIECKHQPNTSIGRPIIQKLHSVAISEGAKKGLIITTGTFSKQAITHARTLKPTIELIDRNMLYDIALRVGFRLKMKEGKEEIYSFPITKNPYLKHNLSNYINHLLISYPSQIFNLINIKKRNITLNPVYLIKYKINSVFTTSIGILHREKGNHTIIINGESGSIFDKNISQYFLSAPLEIITKDTLHNIPNKPFAFLLNEIKEIALREIINTHSKVISYYGRNNQYYQKECIPNKKDILINDIKLAYIPYNDIIFSLNGKNRRIKLADNGTRDSYFYQDNLKDCEICGNRLSEKGILCNECGRISHNETFFNPHGLYCESCGKSICRFCASYSYKYLVFKKTLCINCAKYESSLGKTIHKYT